MEDMSSFFLNIIPVEENELSAHRPSKRQKISETKSIPFYKGMKTLIYSSNNKVSIQRLINSTHTVPVEFRLIKEISHNKVG